MLLLSTVSNSQTLDELLKIVVNENVSLKIIENEYLTSLEKAPQVSQLPDTEIGIGVFPFPVETRLGGQITRLSATQMFPWFGTLDRKADLENAKSKAIFIRKSARELDLFYKIKVAYYRLYEIEQSKSIILENINIMKTLERLALSKVESGNASAVDVLRVLLNIEEMEQELEILEESKTNSRVVINQLLNRSLVTSIDITDKFEFAQILFQKDSLVDNIRDNHPMMRIFELQQDISRKAILLNEINAKPSFGLGLDYIMVNKRSDADPSSNGRDILQLRASLKIPLFKEKYRAKEREEKMKIITLDYKKEDLLLKFRTEIEKSFANYRTAKLRMDLYKKQIKITQSAINILQTNYSTQGLNFDDLLQLEKQLIAYDLKMLKAIVQSHIAKSSIERYIIQ